jgi:hypothetical protein
MSMYSFNLKTEGQIAAYCVLWQESALVSCKSAVGSTAGKDFTRHCYSIVVLSEPY